MTSVCAPAADLRGTIVDGDGKPAVGAVVAATPEVPQRAADGSSRRHITRSDAQGQFVLHDLRPGAYAATATFAGVGATGPAAIELRSQGDAIAVVLVLKREPSRIEGRVHSANVGAPSELKIAAARISGERLEVFYGDVRDGRFELNLPAGQYMLKAVAPGWESGLVAVLLGGQSGPVRLALFDPLGTEPALATELIAMVEADQAVRMRAIESGDDEASGREMRQIDERNQARIKEIIAAGGWPRASRVGSQATDAAWLIVQHAAPDLLRASLPAMQAAADDGELALDKLALSIDRVLVQQGKPQRYGSQGSFDAQGAFVVDPIEDESNVDTRRAQMGLGSLADYKRGIEALYHPKRSAAPGP